MVRVGLTGGIGSGKSTVSRELVRLGARVIDADVVAREVVEPGSAALAAIVQRFGPGIIGSDGALDRPALGRIVFGDPGALADLEGITHPAIWARTAQLMAAAPGGILVHDMPLLVEKAMAGEYHLVVVVGASETIRFERLVTLRAMAPRDARARIGVQASDEQRRAAADVWLDNEGTEAELADAVRRLWRERLVPFEENLARGIRSVLARPVLSPPDPAWPVQAARLTARIRHALGAQVQEIEHIGSTAVPGLAAKDVIDLQVGVEDLAVADAPQFTGAMLAAGFVLVPGIRADRSKEGATWPKRFYGNADPGRIAQVHVRQVGSPGWRWALAFRDLLREDPALRDEYARAKADLAARCATTQEYAQAKEPWFDAVHARIAACVETREAGPTGLS